MLGKKNDSEGRKKLRPVSGEKRSDVKKKVSKTDKKIRDTEETATRRKS